MELEMIINCKVPCVWMRTRDQILQLLSLAMWSALIVLLFRIESFEWVKFISSLYIAMVILVSGLIMAWSHYRKIVFQFLTKKKNRRTRYTSLAPGITAKHFYMEEKLVRALQQKKCTLIQHCKDGDASFILFLKPSSTPSVLLPKSKVLYSEAA